MNGEAEAQDLPIGFVPTPDALDTSGLDLDAGDLDSLLSIDAESGMKEVELIRGHFDFIGERLPAEMNAELDGLQSRLDG